MDSFSIQCTTCCARLKVRGQSLVGQIIACPKCGSMVQVMPSPGPQESAVGSSASAATLAPASASTMAPVAAAPHAAAPAFPPPLPMGAAHAGDNVSADPLELTGDASGVAQLGSSWMMLGGGAAAGVALGGLAWIAILSIGAGSPSSSARVTEPKPLAPVAPQSVEAPQFPKRAGAAMVQRAEREATQAPAESRAVAQSGAQSQQVFKVPTGAPQAAELAGQQPAPDAETAAARPEENAQSAPGPTGGAAALSVPSFGGLPGASASQGAPSDFPLAPNESRAAGQESVQVPSSGPTSDVAAKLAQPIRRIRFERVPMSEFCDFVSQWCSVPVQLDKGALAEAGVDGTTPVSVRLEGASLAAVLEEALAPLKLRFVLRDERIVFTTRPAAARARP